ncbi:response regulator transcription factor [Amycolatopsis sp. EV170708-02-1]|uniref:response regulator transcription factor n=1 Tax=Amycolatopsis sp. EV170708-02-1 TaxID=2919322 RepID=UPI001F0C86AD|nr:response regulator transcription factor [Amycolatopsis sp. EV170708-02-1]UMP06977.1 response regulator transcription factor [Amycolatopsis sp. EV170708-02-1]
MPLVQVAVMSSEPMMRDGATAALHHRPGIRVVDNGSESQADVLVALANDVDGALLSRIEHFNEHANGSPTRVVLVANRLPDYYLLRAIEIGLTSVIHRESTTYDTIAQEAINAHQARSHMPDHLLYTLLERVRATQQQMSSVHGFTPAGLHEREIEVLQLLSEGLDTAQIASRLNYSERTIKNVIRSMMTRLKLKNRSHAVAYAIRCGVV